MAVVLGGGLLLGACSDDEETSHRFSRTGTEQNHDGDRWG
jgi:hypothetical protein